MRVSFTPPGYPPSSEFARRTAQSYNAAVRGALKALFLYVILFLALRPSFEQGGAEQSLPPLPAEAELLSGGAKRGFCSSDFLLRSLGARAFRWVYRPAERSPIWAHGLMLLCDDSSPQAVRFTVLSGKTAVAKTSYERSPGFDGDNVTARVIARLLPLEPAVAAAALRAYIENQPDVARAGADLWRARRWGEAAEHLSLALENNWPQEAQADLYFGLADAYAHRGRPRHAYWYALGYLAISKKQPPEIWLRSLRGAAGILAGQPPSVEPEAEALARRWRQAAAARRPDEALEALKRLSLAAPWADAYQDSVAGVYERLGWTALAESWRRRAVFTRRLAADTALQSRLASLIR